MNLTASPKVWIDSAASSGDLDAEFFLERHHQFDRVEAVRAEIVDERRRFSATLSLRPPPGARQQFS